MLISNILSQYGKNLDLYTGLVYTKKIRFFLSWYIFFQNMVTPPFVQEIDHTALLLGLWLN